MGVIGKGREYTVEEGGPEKKEAGIFFFFPSSLLVYSFHRVEGVAFFFFFFEKKNGLSFHFSRFLSEIGDITRMWYRVCARALVGFITSEYVSKGLRLKPYKSKGPMST